MFNSLYQQMDDRDSPAHASLRNQLTALDAQVAECFQTQPSFHAFVQERFDQEFAKLTPSLDLLHCFIQSADNSRELPPSLMDAVIRRIISGEPAAHAKQQAVFYLAATPGDAPEPYTALVAQAFDGFVDRLANELSEQYPLYLQRYWDAASSATDPHTRRQRLEQIRREQLKNECALLTLDGLLGSSAQTLLDTVLEHPDALARQALKGHRPCVYALALGADDSSAVPLHGAFVLTTRDPQDGQVGWAIDAAAPVVRAIEPSANVGRVLLSTCGQGLEAFDSLASLDRELHRRLGHAMECASLLAMVADKDQEAALALHRRAPTGDQVRYLERLDSPFQFAIEAQCRLISDNFASTLARYQTLGVHADMAHLPRALDRLGDLQRAFSLEPVLQARHQKRARARLQAFLAGASDVDQSTWAQAFADYAATLADLPDPEGLPSLSQFSDRRALLAYSNRQLRAVLESEHGLMLDPDDLLVTTREPDVAPPTYVPGAQGSTISEPRGAPRRYRSRTLSELALENVGGLDFNFSNFSTLNLKPASGLRPAGIPSSPNINPVAGLPAYDGLSIEQVKDLVRRLNVGQTYRDFLQAQLVTSEPAKRRKQTFARLMAAQLHLDAIEARIAGDFAVDELARGYHWVKAVLEQPVDNAQRMNVEGHRIIVQSLHLRGQRVRGVLLFGTASNGAGSVVVYTPQAPDGRVFHEYAKERLMLDFVHHSAWRDYLVARVELAFQPHVRASVQGRGDASVVNLAPIAGNVFEEGYEVEASFAINDAAAQTTTTGQTDIDTGLSVAELVLDVVSMVLPIRVTLPIGLARSLFALFNAIEAAKIGDRSATAHHLVRALGEFTGALIDGAVGKGLTGATPKTVASARRLNPQMALGKAPQGLSVLPGWENKGVHYRLSNVDGRKQYFLKDADHWYSIIDEGFEEAWRIRDARKPVQHHYAPIRRDATGHWEIGTHRDAPALGGGAPQRALQDLYPFLDEFQVGRVFESFMFPSGRELEFSLSLVHYLRAGRSLAVFDGYLIVSPERLLLRLRGLDLAQGFTGGGVVRESAQPTLVEGLARPGRPSAPEPTPGPRQPSAVATRPAHEQFVDWGQALDPVHLQVRNAELAIYRRTAGEPQLIGRDYVKIDQRYFPILPAGAEIKSGIVLMHEPSMPLDSFVAFEQLLGADLYRQPRLATFDASLSRWLNSMELSFETTLGGYVADAFPTFAPHSHLQIADVLFNLGNPSGLTVWGMAAMQRTLQSWRSRSAPSLPVLGDPLSMLPITRTNAAGVWRLDNLPDLYHRLHFSAESISVLMHEALSLPTERVLKSLMVERLVGSHYQMFVSFNQPGELLFRRSGSDQLFWLTLRKATHGLVEGPYQVAPRLDQMSSLSRTLVQNAQAANRFVQLIGGVHLPGAGERASIFVFRV